ncbi:GL18356 [Drosophila persimilis]|uniref:GL18356 n=1 Tax=Drosophila persimilis TaxID=7234 RepID=B4HCP5_DROPE|nr:GL18356 [Drosophila persimilis]
MFKSGPDGKEKERPHSDPLELLKNLGTRANELVKRMNDQRHVDNVMKDLALRVITLQALVVNNFEKVHTRTIATSTIGTQTAAKLPHTGSKRLRESPQMAAEPTKRQRGTKLQQASTQLKPQAQSQEELTPSGTVDHGATPAAKKQLNW